MESQKSSQVLQLGKLLDAQGPRPSRAPRRAPTPIAQSISGPKASAPTVQDETGAMSRTRVTRRPAPDVFAFRAIPGTDMPRDLQLIVASAMLRARGEDISG